MTAAGNSFAALLALTVVCLHHSTGEQRVYRVGSDIKPTRSGVDTAGTSYVLETDIAHAGRVFAFSAFFRVDRAVRFQLWRPVANASEPLMFSLIDEMKLIPSVKEAREDLFAESRQRDCVYVQPGDRFGVYIEEAPGSIAYEFSRESSVLKYKVANLSRLTAVGDSVVFDALRFPYVFSMAVYIDTEIGNLTADPADGLMPCPIGLAIPSGTVTLPPTTPTPPPTGAPGAAGPVGPRGGTGPDGPAGAIGEAGPPGDAGAVGAAGVAGPAGAEGAVGPAGANGTDGADGADGTNGAAGAVGARGEAGETGPAGGDGRQGLRGEAGAPGEKGETGLQGPAGKDGVAVEPQAEASSSSSFWTKDWTIRGFGIWLIVVSVLLVIVFIWLCCLVVRRRRRRENRPNAPDDEGFDYDTYKRQQMARVDASGVAGAAGAAGTGGAGGPAAIPPYDGRDWLNSLRADEYKEVTVDTITRDGKPRSARQPEETTDGAAGYENHGASTADNGGASSYATQPPTAEEALSY